MSATISPPIVQFALIQRNNRKRIQWLAAAATEDIAMFAQEGLLPFIGRAAVLAAIAALVLATVDPSLALAGSAPSGTAMSAAAATSDATDFSAQRCYHRRDGVVVCRRLFAPGWVGGRGFGPGWAPTTASQNRAYYDDRYGGGPVYHPRSSVPYSKGRPQPR